MKTTPAPIYRKNSLTEGMSPTVHISYIITFVSNLMAFGGIEGNVKRFGLTLMQWRIIGMIGQTGPMTLSELASTNHQDKSTMSRAALALEKNGLLCTMPNKRHKRSPLIWFTEKGLFSLNSNFTN